MEFMFTYRAPIQLKLLVSSRVLCVFDRILPNCADSSDSGIGREMRGAEELKPRMRGADEPQTRSRRRGAEEPKRSSGKADKGAGAP